MAPRPLTATALDGAAGGRISGPPIRVGDLTAVRWTRRRYVIMDRGSRAHVVGKTRAAGPETRCGKRGGEVRSWAMARNLELCASCLRGMIVP